ncbi:hypothetical protein N5E02_04130 [Stenotrophomonas sp. GD03777]|uniref:hypothetical protein n=1 Tax=Stenotrophomonas sp. GD03777 TaxID=2975380 RepID=UPI0024492DB4|nr:hypothetical protein [Stenotrophomonas sp. GD03777]MDH1660602.1 hypothetical protein [Stenotrophomonas sp. GD03777]
MSNDKKTLADVQPGGTVRLATVLYDRAHDLLGDAYNAGTHGIGYSQQAMELHDAIIPAQPSQVAYHGDVDLKWLSGSIGEVAHRLSTYMPTGLAEWADRARDCRIAAQVLSELSAQPSPGGQGGLNYERMFVDACAALAEVSRELGCDPEQGGAEPILAAIAELREALAARQPVGEPVGEKLVRLLRERAALPESVELSYQRDGDGTGRAWWDRRHAELEAQGYSLDFETDSGAEWYTLRGIGDELRAALAEYDAAPPAQPVGVPAAWMHTHKATGRVEFGLSPMYDCDFNAEKWDSMALYAAPPVGAK